VKPVLGQSDRGHQEDRPKPTRAPTACASAISAGVPVVPTLRPPDYSLRKSPAVHRHQSLKQARRGLNRQFSAPVPVVGDLPRCAHAEQNAPPPRTDDCGSRPKPNTAHRDDCVRRLCTCRQAQSAPALRRRPADGRPTTIQFLRGTRNVQRLGRLALQRHGKTVRHGPARSLPGPRHQWLLRCNPIPACHPQGKHQSPSGASAVPFVFFGRRAGGLQAPAGHNPVGPLIRWTVPVGESLDIDESLFPHPSRRGLRAWPIICGNSTTLGRCAAAWVHLGTMSYTSSPARLPVRRTSSIRVRAFFRQSASATRGGSRSPHRAFISLSRRAYHQMVRSKGVCGS